MRALAQFGGEHFIPGGIVDHSSHSITLAFDCERDAKDRVTVGEVGGAIERIDMPSVITASLNARAFFAHHIVSGKLCADSVENQRLGFTVSDGDEVRGALVFD